MVAACQMAEIADEELSEVIPTQAKPVSEKFKDIGYYTDEKGIKRYGVIPDYSDKLVKGTINTGYIPGYNITSNPNYR
jgi:predicted urease superfamily metal-dependent hydrolase